MPYYETGRAYQAMGDYTNSLDYLRQYEILSEADEAQVNYKYKVLREALETGGPQGY